MNTTNPHSRPALCPHALLRIGFAIFVTAALAGCSSKADTDKDADVERGSASSVGDEAEARSETDDATESEPARLVRTTNVRIGTIRNEIETSGDLEAEFWADLHPRSSGFVRTLSVEEGDRVEHDAILATLDDDQVRLELTSAEIRIRETERQLERQAATIAELEQRLEQQKLLEARKLQEYSRAVDIPEGVLSEEEVAEKRYQYEDAKIARGAAELALRGAEEDARVTTARLEAAEVERDVAALMLEHTNIRAPIPGVIAERNIRVGARIGPESKAFTLVDTSRLVAYVHVPQREVRFLAAGQRAEIRCDAVPGRVFTGRVRTVSPVIDAGNLKLTLEVDNPEDLLIPGMFLSIRIILDEHENARLVPKKALLHDRDRPYVFVVRDGIARRVDIEQGYRDRDSVEALVPDDATAEALAAPVVIRGQENLEDGVRVRIESAPTSPPAR